MAEEREIQGNDKGEHGIPAQTGKPNQRAIEVRLGAAAKGKYKVWKKPIPDNAPTTHNGKTITWINNFGLKKGNNHHYEDTVPEYTIVVDSQLGAELFYLDAENQVQSLPHTVKSGKFEAKLTLGDPPIGAGS